MMFSLVFPLSIPITNTLLSLHPNSSYVACISGAYNWQVPHAAEKKSITTIFPSSKISKSSIVFPATSLTLKLIAVSSVVWPLAETKTNAAKRINKSFFIILCFNIRIITLLYCRKKSKILTFYNK